MDDKELVELGMRCARLFAEAQKLNAQIEDEVCKRVGFDDVEDYEKKTGLEFENDVLIDSLQIEWKFSKRTWKGAISHQRDILKGAGVDG